MAAALANRAIGAVVGSAVADAAGNNIKCHSHCKCTLEKTINLIIIKKSIHVFSNVICYYIFKVSL